MRSSHVVIAAASVLLASAFPSVTPAGGVTLAEVRIEASAVAGQCSPIAGEHPLSPDAAEHHADDEADCALGFPRVGKSYQSFRCGASDATVYYYQYADKTQAKAARSFARARLWGGPRPPGKGSERIFTVANVLMVVSGAPAKLLEAELRGAKTKRRASVQPERRVLRVAVLADGLIVLDGAPTTLGALRRALRAASPENDIVWLYRQESAVEGSTEAGSVGRAILQNGLSVSVSTQPDFSDVVLANGCRPARRDLRRRDRSRRRVSSRTASDP